MKYTKLFIVSISAVLFAALALCAGCSGTDEAAVEAAAIESAPVAEELPLPEELKTEGKVTSITTTMLKNPPTLHPIYVMDEDTKNLLSLICEPAIKLDYSDKPSSSVIESWTFDETGTTVIFTVRKGLKFHGNRGEVTAQDLKFCLDLITEADESECSYSRYKGLISSYTVIDTYKLQLDMSYKTGDIYYLMNFPVIPELVYSTRTKDSVDLPVGTGPYEAASYSSDTGMKLRLNESWWRVAPSITEIAALPVEDNESKLAGYQLGTYNFAAMTEMTANSYRAQKNTTAYKTNTQYYEALVPNMSNRFLQDKTIRQAISLAIDRREIISTGAMGGGVAAITPMRSDLWYFQGTASSLIEYDTAKAETLLEDAGYYKSSDTGYRYQENLDGSKGYITMELIYCESKELYYRGTIADLIAGDLAEIGIRLNVKELETAEYEKALENGNFDLAFTSFYTTYDNDLSYLFGLNAECNYGGYINEELASLISGAKAALTEKEQQDSYTALNNMLADKLPHIGLYFREYIVYADKNIGNIKTLRGGAVFADINSWE